MSVVTALWHCGDDSSPPHTHCVDGCDVRLSSTLCVCVCLGVSVCVCVCVCVVCVCVCVSHSFTLTHSFPLTHSHSLTSTHLSNHIFISPLIVSRIFTNYSCVVCVLGGVWVGGVWTPTHPHSSIPSHSDSLPNPPPHHRTLCVCAVHCL